MVNSHSLAAEKSELREKKSKSKKETSTRKTDKEVKEHSKPKVSFVRRYLNSISYNTVFCLLALFIYIGVIYQFFVQSSHILGILYYPSQLTINRIIWPMFGLGIVSLGIFVMEYICIYFHFTRSSLPLTMWKSFLMLIGGFNIYFPVAIVINAVSYNVFNNLGRMLMNLFGKNLVLGFSLYITVFASILCLSLGVLWFMGKSNSIWMTAKNQKLGKTLYGMLCLVALFFTVVIIVTSTLLVKEHNNSSSFEELANNFQKSLIDHSHAPAQTQAMPIVL
ncbi:hypothetical protein NEFER03_1555 [Nematocida sp. LUAm3]|nr:hypothetical protein NEFER03_1555 [Nematocida sp. LUAm3]KAI5174588.1 hypothetical protein NEFER02_0709 [Nematocida sp. LUAm2]KAI5178006.1 hypothetical protein NEFER01_1188 [Nematocida sp. LUAm1]